MTPAKIQSLKLKITAIKRTLAAEKKKFGGYFDNHGLRYAILELYVKLEDYKSGLAYTKWFQQELLLMFLKGAPFASACSV